MATHINSVADLEPFACCDKAAFWHVLEEGQILYVVGNAEISKAIQTATHSLLSHVGTIVKYQGEWCLFEAIFPHGVVITPLWKYIEGGEVIILTRRVSAGGMPIDQAPALNATLSYLGLNYAALGLVKEGLHRVFPCLPPELNQRSCYCSGVTWKISQATVLPFPAAADGGAPAPEDLWRHQTTQVICALVRP
jgi:Permuted papain-like amidase enzyme, YaeF/YiiX, C92 family